MSATGKLRALLLPDRTSVRLAFLLRAAAMAAGALLSLLFFRLFLDSMGAALFGLFLVFQSVARLGGLGDLGITGVISIKGGLLLGRGEHEELRALLAAARTLFLLLAAALFVLFAVLSPWLPGWLEFENVAGAGSYTVLFLWGGASASAMILGGYFQSLNYAHGTVTWPILPSLIIGSLLAPLLHWLLARTGAPLWLQTTPYLAASILSGWLAWRMLKWSHPWLGDLWPLKIDRAQWRMLARTSGWLYLCTLGSVIYHTTDRLVLKAGFGSEIIPMYTANYKACELAVILILSASFVSLPKITQWISSQEEADRRRLLLEAGRLNLFQIMLGTGAALVFLALNDLFIRFWLGADSQGPLAWQLAFACNLAVATGGDTGIQLATRCGDKGIKVSGLVIICTGLINVLLSIVSMRLGSITGVAVATVIAHSILSLWLGWYACRHLGLSAARWSARSWLLPLAVVLTAGVLKFYLPGSSLSHLGLLLVSYVVLLIVTGVLAGMSRKILGSELAVLRSMLKR